MSRLPWEKNPFNSVGSIQKKKLYSIIRRSTKADTHTHTQMKKPSATVASATWLVTIDILLGWMMTLSGCIFLENQMTQHQKNVHDTIFFFLNCTFFFFFSVYIIWFVCFFLNLNVDSCRSLVYRSHLFTILRWWWHSLPPPSFKEIKKSFVLYTQISGYRIARSEWIIIRWGGDSHTHTQKRAEVDNFSTEPPP